MLSASRLRLRSLADCQSASSWTEPTTAEGVLHPYSS
jgi:hypothetical protein